MRFSIVALFFLFSLSSRADRINSPSYTPVHSYAYDYTCIMSYPDGTWRQDDGIVINFPEAEKPLEVGVVDDGDLGAFLDCSMQNQDGVLALDCKYTSITYKIKVQSDLSGKLTMAKPSGTRKYSLSCRDNR